MDSILYFSPGFLLDKYFAKEYDVDKKDILLMDKLYGASITAFLEVISKLDNKHKSAIILSKILIS